MIEPSIQKQDTQMRAAIPAELKLQVTLKFLASGNSFKSLSLFFQIPPSSISLFLLEVWQAINSSSQPSVKVGSLLVNGFNKFWFMVSNHIAFFVLQFPQTHAEWDRIAAQFEQQ